MSVEVVNLSDKTQLTYSDMPPAKALVCAFEQGRGNFNTWDYKDPSDYGIVEGMHFLHLGTFCVLKGGN